MRDKKAQGLPLRQIIVAAIVMLVLVVVAMIGPGGIQKGFNNLLWAIGLAEDEDATSGDYILQAYAEIENKTHLLLHFSANPFRCAKIRNSKPYTIDEGFAPGLTDYIPPSGFKKDAVTVGDRGDNCDADYEISIPMTSPGEIGTRILRINVHGADQGGVLETVPVEATWEALLSMYLNAQMRELGAEYDDTFAIMWSYEMHRDPTPTPIGDHPKEHSLDLSDKDIEDAFDLLGLGEEGPIEDVPDLFEGTFKDFLSKLACTESELDTKQNALQIVTTALFGDLQDFDETTGKSPTEGQDWYRVRDGVGMRGWTDKRGMTDQLMPTQMIIEYSGLPSGSIGSLKATVRAKDDLLDPLIGDGGMTYINGAAGTCLEDKRITVRISVYKSAPEEAPEPEGQNPGDMEDGDCFVSSGDPCGGLLYYIKDGDWICMYDIVLDVEHARHCEDGTISEVRDCSCRDHACEMSSSLDEGEWSCV